VRKGVIRQGGQVLEGNKKAVAVKGVDHHKSEVTHFLSKEVTWLEKIRGEEGEKGRRLGTGRR